MISYKPSYLVPGAALVFAIGMGACGTKRHNSTRLSTRSHQVANTAIQRDSTSLVQRVETGSATVHTVQRAIEIDPQGTLRIYHQEQRLYRDSSVNQQVGTTMSAQLQARSDRTVTYETSQEKHAEKTVLFRPIWLIGIAAVPLLFLFVWIKRRLRR